MLLIFPFKNSSYPLLLSQIMLKRVYYVPFSMFSVRFFFLLYNKLSSFNWNEITNKIELYILYKIQMSCTLLIIFFVKYVIELFLQYIYIKSILNGFILFFLRLKTYWTVGELLLLNKNVHSYRKILQTFNFVKISYISKGY